jgi:hypothetical protein
MGNMKTRKMVLSLCLGMLLPLVLSQAAGSALVTKGKQVVGLYATSNISYNYVGIPFNTLKQVMPDGSQSTFTIPDNMYFVTTYVAVNLNTTVSYTGLVDYLFGPYFSVRQSMSGTYLSAGTTLDPGFIMSGLGATYTFQVVNANTGGPIPGILTVRVVGFLTPKN